MKSNFSLVLMVAASLWASGCGGDKGIEIAPSAPETGATKATYSVGGVVTGLKSAALLTLKNNDSETLNVRLNGSFAFTRKAMHGDFYNVTVTTQPSGQTCAVKRGKGTVGDSPVTDLIVECTGAVAPTLLFKTSFGKGVTLNAPTGMTDSNAWQIFSGKDETTGFSFPVSALGSNSTGLQLIGPYLVTGTSLTKDNINNYFGNAVRTVPGPNGYPATELFLNLKKKDEPVGNAMSQIPLMIVRPWKIGDIKELYMSYWFKYPANLPDLLDHKVPAGNWRVLFEFKTGGYKDPKTGVETYGGDYRIKTVIMKSPDDGHLYWSSAGDNVANAPVAAATKTYWFERNHTVPVPLGKWFKFELYWYRSSGGDGRYWAAVDGQVIADHRGSTMGDLGLPVTRIMVHNVYTGGLGPVQGEITDLEIWNTFPCGINKSCYAPPTKD